MSKYKSRFKSNIYHLNYDLLVTSPCNEIRSLMQCLGWKWSDSYLFPYFNTRSFSTARNVQVCSQIHSNSVGG